MPINLPADRYAATSDREVESIQAMADKKESISRSGITQSQHATLTMGKKQGSLQKSAGKRKLKDLDAFKGLPRKKPVLLGDSLSNRILKYVGENVSKDVEDLAAESSITVLSSIAKTKLAAFVYRDTSQDDHPDLAQGTKWEAHYDENVGEEHSPGFVLGNATPNVPASSGCDFNEKCCFSEVTAKNIDEDPFLDATDSTHEASLLLTEEQKLQELGTPSRDLTEGRCKVDLSSLFPHQEVPTTRHTDRMNSDLVFEDDEFSVTELESMDQSYGDSRHGAPFMPYQPDSSGPGSEYHKSDYGEMEIRKTCTDSVAIGLPNVQAGFSGLTESEGRLACTKLYFDLTTDQTAIDQPCSTSADGDDYQSYSDDGLDLELIELTTVLSTTEGQNQSSSPTTPATIGSPKLQWLPPKNYTPRPPVPLRYPKQAIDASHTIISETQGTILPFVRPSFPKSVRDRSPIVGLTNHTVLRTCFRIGEALNAAAAASRSNTEAIIELYARVLYSERRVESVSQQFQFSDLFTMSKPPYLSGTYDLWKSSDLWEHDSKAFLGLGGQGRIARVVGRIKRNDKGLGCKMTILSIWEASWEDIGWVKGIVCA